VSDALLLRAGVHDPDSFDEREVLQLATHLASPAHARDAYELALALGSLPRWQHEALEQRIALIVAALEHPEVTGSEANNLAGARRIAAEHLLTDPAAIERLRFASNSYLLSHDPEELARQARLMEPLPRSGTVRVAVAPEPEPDHWKVDVACRDTAGLLARLTDVLTEYGVDIAAAAIATWPDGAVLDSFIVRTNTRPGAKVLAERFEARLRAPLRSMPMPDLVVAFDNNALPWHTAVVVSGPDRPGALLAAATAFAVANVMVHTARIASDEQGVNDRFAISDRLGRKLDAATMERVQHVLAGDRIRRHRFSLSL
jgi:[protein-PII] uridylyltransferase